MVVEAGLDPPGVVFVVEQIDAFADQGHRGFKQASVEGEAAVLGHRAAGHDAEVVFEVIRGAAQALHVLGKTLPG